MFIWQLVLSLTNPTNVLEKEYLYVIFYDIGFGGHVLLVLKMRHVYYVVFWVNILNITTITTIVYNTDKNNNKIT